MTCDRCMYQGDDGLCYCDEPSACPRGLIEEDAAEEAEEIEV